MSLSSSFRRSKLTGTLCAQVRRFPLLLPHPSVFWTFSTSRCFSSQIRGDCRQARLAVLSCWRVWLIMAIASIWFFFSAVFLCSVIIKALLFFFFRIQTVTFRRWFLFSLSRLSICYIFASLFRPVRSSTFSYPWLSIPMYHRFR